MAVIAIDFDHTIIEGDKAITGAREAINIFREKGHKIIIHSCNNIGWIIKTLTNNDIRYDQIWEGIGKPLADLYIDDKGFHFQGDWHAMAIAAVLTRVEGLDNRKW